MKKCPSCNEELSWETEFCPGCGTETDYFMQPAGFWIRVAAYILDFFIVGIPLWIIGIILGIINPAIVLSVTYIIIISSPKLLYKPIMESIFGATFGKMICKIRVLNDEGNKLSIAMAYVRFFPFLIATLAGLALSAWMYSQPNFQDPEFQLNMIKNPTFLIILLFVVTFGLFSNLDCLFAAFTERKRAIHDMMAGSYCVYKPSVEKMQAIADMPGQGGDQPKQEYREYFTPEEKQPEQGDQGD